MPISEIDARFKEFMSGKDIDLIASAIHLEEFLATIFPIKDQLDECRKQAEDFNIIYEFKRNFVQRRALRKYTKDACVSSLREVRSATWQSPFNNDEIATRSTIARNDDANSTPIANLSILELARQILFWLQDEEKYATKLDKAAKYCAYKVYFDPDSIAFQMPKKLDFEHLVTKDPSTRITHSLDQSHYCIFCHKQKKDSCRTGIHDGKKIISNPLGNKLTGCPLGQKISEMNLLYSTGNIVAALAVVMMDNPLVAATGDRICNDCMKSCIYQKQEPVDIPHIESQMLKDVLSFPFGAEIYYLLSRWNPLALATTLAHTQQKILIVGLGPAGFAMAYYMLQQGHYVTAIDGLDITPLPEEFFQPIENWPKLITDLGPYKPQGFGGVAEYGITDRWDKYNLLLIRMLLERYPNFEMRGNFRLGRDITIKDAIEKDGYDYIALCLGAGSPKNLNIKNIDAKGVISAFTFLASLHMNKPGFEYKMPVVIVGAGLTAMDSAMAAQKYHNNNDKDVTIIYRKSMQDSPSYKENHHELQMTLDSGVKFLENTELESIEVNEVGNIISINKNIPVGTLVYSIGTHPNDKIFATEVGAFKLYKDRIGIFGDMDPEYAGTVVKAIASIRDWVYNIL